MRPIVSEYREILHLLRSRPVLLRAIKYAVVVGILLLVINHGDAIVHGDLTPGRLVRMGLTVLVPFGVSAFSSIGALRGASRQSSGE